MGGSAFSSQPYALLTPRMPPVVYRSVRDECQDAIRQHFHCVVTPIEGPGKQDYGDVDILVALDKQQNRPLEQAFILIKQSLGAEHEIHACKTRNFAIRWPEVVEHIGADGLGGDQRPGVPDIELPDANHNPIFNIRRRYIQVDVRICDSVDELQWMLFKHAHGDLWSLLGTTIRPFGLTIDEKALWLRVPEIEQVDKMKARVFLTDEPDEILQFLGLEHRDSIWEEPFASEDALFEYAASCRLFYIKPPEEQHMDDVGTGDEGGPVGQEGGEPGRRKLRSNDRKRMRSRPVFHRWVEDFIPRCRAQGRFLSPRLNDGSEAGPSQALAAEHMRAVVRDDAFARYPLARYEFGQRLSAFQKQRLEDEVWRSAIKGTVPCADAADQVAQHRRSVVVSALKKVILLEDASFGIRPPAEIKTSEGLFDVEAVRRWVARIWPEVEAVAWEKQLERAREALERKNLRRQEEGVGEEEEEKIEVI